MGITSMVLHFVTFIYHLLLICLTNLSIVLKLLVRRERGRIAGATFPKRLFQKLSPLQSPPQEGPGSIPSQCKHSHKYNFLR
jgi:hypothetical protein